MVRNATFSDRELYLARSHFGDSLADCVSFAVSAEYRVTGTLLPSLSRDTAMTLMDIAFATGKILYLYRAGAVDIVTANVQEGVGTICLHEDLDGNYTVVCWKDENGALVTISSRNTASISSRNTASISSRNTASL